MFRSQFLTLVAFAAMLLPHAHAQSDAEPPTLPVDTAGLLAFYGFGPDSMVSFPDQGLNGVMVGEPDAVMDRFGNANGALYFGPGERVDIPGAAGLNPLPFSVSLWFQPDLAQIPENFVVSLFKKYYPALWNGMMLWYKRKGQQDYLSAWYIRNSSNRIISEYGSPFFDYLEPEPGQDIWHHAVFTVDSVEGRIYVDGVLQDAQFWDGEAAAPTNNLPWQIGGTYQWSDTIGFVGRIDDVSVWQRALDEADVFALYAEDGWDAHGCADVEACNFEPFALVNDGTCIYPIVGEDCLDGASICADGTWWHPGEQRCYPHPCLDCPGDINDDAQVNVGDLLDLLGVFGSDCSFEGCTDEHACNFNPMALVNDSSCVYVSEIYDCNYNCINDSDGDGVCDEQEIVGCQNTNACNYDPTATDDSGDCILPGTNECGCPVDCSGELLNEDNCECDEDIPGCTDQTACNFNPEATDEDGSCVYGEGTPGAPCDDGNPATHFDVYDENGCSCAGEPLVDPAGSGPCEGETAVTFGETTYGLVELGGHCWFRENLSTTTYANGDEIPVVEEAAAWAEAADGARAAYDNALETNGFLYNWMAVADARGVCPTGWQVPSDTMWMALETDLGLPSDQTQATGLRGTTEGAALKAAPPAWNGTDAAAFTGLPEGFRTNTGNFNNSGLLGYWWSTTPDAPNHAWYRALSEFNDQIYRNIFNRRAGLHIRCVKGEQPTVCNGTPGASCDDGDPNTFNDVYDDMGCACAGTDAVELDGSGPCEGEASVNYHGHDYLLVEIGDQCWFRENLQTMQYANGDSIPTNLNDEEWFETLDGAFSIYWNEYGAGEVLYNWYAATDMREICPSGWRVPSTGDFSVLEVHLGMSTTEAYSWSLGWRGIDEGAELKQNSSTYPDWGGNNMSGFSALPAGRRHPYGNFEFEGVKTIFWTTTPVGPHAFFRALRASDDKVQLNTDHRTTGNSVRCIKQN